MRRITIGAVTGIFGLKGDLKVRPFVGDDTILNKLKNAVFIDKNGAVAEVKILSAKRHKDIWLIKVAGADTPEAAMAYKGSQIQVSDSLLPPAESGEVYWVQIEGARVVDSQGLLIGTLTGYIETGAHDVFEIEGHDGLGYMISNNPSHVLSIDTENKTVTVDRIGLVASS